MVRDVEEVLWLVVDRAVVNVLLVFSFVLVSRFLRVGTDRTMSLEKQLMILVSIAGGHDGSSGADAVSEWSQNLRSSLHTS